MRILTVAVLLSGALAAAPALAQSSEDEEILDTVPVNEGTDRAPPPEEEERSVTYSGVGLSKVSTDFENLEDAVNLDFALGIRVPTIKWISAEINLSFTIIPGENTGQEGCTQDPGFLFGGPTNCPDNQTASRNDLQMNNVGVFGVLRSPGRFYAMGKYGYRYINSSIEEIQEGDDKSGGAWALGGGWRWGKGLSGIELAYTQYSSQIEYYGFNIAYGFGGRGAP